MTYTSRNTTYFKCVLLGAVLTLSIHLTYIFKDTLQENLFIIHWTASNKSSSSNIQGYRETAAQIIQREEIKNVCSQLRVNLTLPRSRHFIVNHEYKLLYCWIHKAASTSWIAFFSHLAKRTHINQFYREITVLSPKNAEELQAVIANKRYYKFIVVRHPFQRLVSAYRDRIQDNSRFSSQAWIYVPRIFSLTRPTLNRTQIFNINHKPKLALIPTFQEFVTWLLLIPPTKFDVHWNLYSDHCGVCGIHYDVVIKMDNFSHEEETALLYDMRLSHLNISLQHFQRTSGGATDFHISCQYFKQLTREQAEELYVVFKMDFEMFQYSPKLYVNCAQSDSSSTDIFISR